MRRKGLSTIVKMLGLVVGLTTCGQPGGEDISVSGLSVAKDVVGSISSQSGGQTDLAGWVVVLIDKETQICRVSEVDAAGLISFPNTPLNRTYGLALLSPTFVLQSIFSVPAVQENFVQNFFSIDEKGVLPKLIHKGPIVSFQEFKGIKISKEASLDADGDQIPNGMDGDLALLFLEQGSQVDTDLDGIKNTDDMDIDADGLLNKFDSDDDNDAILDVFDDDANGDLLPDALQNLSDPYFPEGLDWLAVKLNMIFQDDGSIQRTLTFATKLMPGSDGALSLQIRGSASLLNGALAETKDENAETTSEAWDRRLLDDGQNEDGAKGDGLYGRKIILDTGRSPIPGQVLFFQIAYGSEKNPWFKEFPFVFAPLKLSTFTTRYDALTLTVALDGEPFGKDYTDYNWSVTVYHVQDEVDTEVYSSQTIPGSTNSFELPETVFEVGGTYKYKVSAYVLDRIPGYPSYIVESKKSDMGIVKKE